MVLLTRFGGWSRRCEGVSVERWMQTVSRGGELWTLGAKKLRYTEPDTAAAGEPSIIPLLHA